jgi:cell division transport system permease protein
VALCLVVFAFFTLVYLNLVHFTREVAKELVLNVYLKPGTQENDVGRLEREISSEPLVAGIHFVSSSEVLEELKKLFPDPAFLEGVEASFLPPVLIVSFKDPFVAAEELPQIAKKLEDQPQVERVQYARTWLMRLKSLKSFFEVLALSGLFLLGAATVFIVALTVRFSLSERREELEILSLVGATAGFIQAPLLIISFLEGLLASGLSLAVLLGLKFYLDQALRELFPGFESGLVFFRGPEIFILVSGVVTLCLVGSYWASRRFLRY